MNKLVQIFLLILISGSFVFAQTYVGPEKCLVCHNGTVKPDKTGWRTSMHANGYSVVLNDDSSMVDLYGVVCDYDQNGVDDFKDGLNFNNINSVFDPDKPNAPILSYNNGYFIQIGQVTHKVYLTYGGSGLYKQRYVLRINTSEGESNDFYISPIQYNEKTDEYVLYHHEAWYDENNNNEPIFTPTSTLADASTNSRSFTKGCAGCHVTNLSVMQDANGEWISSGAPVEDEALYVNYNNIYDIDQDGDLDQLNNGCENCHGPGGDHVLSLSAADIINPKTDLSVEQANNLCGMCHSRGKSKPNNTFSFPFDDANLVTWAIGDLVATWYTDGGGYYGDAFSSRQHHQQFYDFYKNTMPTNQSEPVACYNCHDIHNTVKHHIREEIEEEDSTGAPIIITTENDNNTLCLACHATNGAFANISKEMVADYQNNITEIGNIVSAHTRHSYDPEGSPGESRCSKCHQPKSVKSAINYDIHSHTFEVLQPEKTTTFQMPNACAVSCHRDIENGGSPLFNTGVDANLGDWSEQTDIDLADTLMHWYGPAGIWWTHVVSVEVVDLNTPDNYLLSQNYPNPFNPTTQIEFSVPVESNVSIVVYDLVGREVATLVNENMPSGNYSLTWNAAGLTSGVYFYRMESQNYVEVKKMIMLK